ncbi:MAG: NINE protein [Bacilli bacterium]|nr:NINE protein [Bacilli bacterium]
MKKNIKKNTKSNKKINSSTSKTNNILNDKNYKNAEKLYKSKDYENSYQEFYELISKYKGNKKIYKRLLDTLTKDFTYKENNKSFKLALNNYVELYKKFATKREIKLLESKLEEYRKVKAISNKSKFLLIAFLGYFGIHKFIERKYILGFLYLFTLGFLGIGVVIDLISDYATYEDDKQLNIFRYFISLIILIFGILRMDNSNYYYIIIASILFTPIVYSFLLKYIPSIIKLIGIIVLIYFGFKTETIIEKVPNRVVGIWKTDNENTNYSELNIKLDSTTISFKDRDKETGTNTYDEKNNILTIKVSDTIKYKFKIYSNDEVCTYNESNKCLISFKK